MRVFSILFALMLVMGLSFGGSTFIGSQSAIAETHEEGDAGEMPGGDMDDEAAGDEDAADADTGEAEDSAVMPGGEGVDEDEEAPTP
ncbi:MAG: hypothetical protein RIG61_02540 [Deltaproteobacteria bacterium]